MRHGSDKMKRHKDGQCSGVSKKRKTQRNRVLGNGNQINELLKLCLGKVCELQENLGRQDDLDDDPQAAGYTACALETIKFLATEGLPSDHPMVKVLTDKLFGDAT